MKETTARVEEGGEASKTKVNTVDDREVEAAEAPKRSSACVLEPPTSVSDAPRPSDHLVPVLLRRPYAVAPIEVAGLELAQESNQRPEETAQERESGPSAEEQQSRAAGLELEQCLAAMGDPSEPLAPATPTLPPPMATPLPVAPGPREVEVEV